MNSLKKLLLTVAAAGFLQTATSQTLNYDIRFGLFNSKLGEITYDIDDRNLSMEINGFVDLKFNYFMPDDSTYVETYMGPELVEKYFYSRTKSHKNWHLDNYVAVIGTPREEKSYLDETNFDLGVLTPIETLEKVLDCEVDDTMKVIIFGEAYNLIVQNKILREQSSFYKGNIGSYAHDKSETLLFEEKVTLKTELIEDDFIPKAITVKTKMLAFIPVALRVSKND